MRQFDVFDNPDRELADLMRSVVVLNHDAFSDVPTVLVAPLFPAERRIPYRELCPAVDVLGARMLVGLTDLAFDRAAPSRTARRLRARGA
jgi:hypothetical protein